MTPGVKSYMHTDFTHHVPAGFSHRALTVSCYEGPRITMGVGITLVAGTQPLGRLVHQVHFSLGLSMLPELPKMHTHLSNKVIGPSGSFLSTT